MRKEKAKEIRKTSPQAALIHISHPLVPKSSDAATLLFHEAKWMPAAVAIDC
jgi:hypothetical protein